MAEESTHVLVELMENARQFGASNLRKKSRKSVEMALPPESEVSGVLVLAVRPNRGAAAAGLRGTEIGKSIVVSLGDIIQKISDRTVRNMNDLTLALESHSPGDVVTVGFLRDGRSESADITLER